jgi:excisionase family DNA binding protein
VSPALEHLAAAVAAALDDPDFREAVAFHRGQSLGVLSTPLLDADAVAELLNLRPSTVLAYARDGRLPCRLIGRHVRFVRAEVERAVASDALAPLAG